MTVFSRLPQREKLYFLGRSVVTLTSQLTRLISHQRGVGEQFQHFSRMIDHLQNHILAICERLNVDRRDLVNLITSLVNRITALGNRMTAVEGAQEQLLEQVRAIQANMDEITTEEVRSQHSHCSAMYREFCDELRNLRAEKRNESDEDVRAELTAQMRRIEAAAQKMELSGHIV